MNGFDVEIAAPVVSHVDWAPSVRLYLFQPSEALPLEVEGVRAPERPTTAPPVSRGDGSERPT